MSDENTHPGHGKHWWGSGWQTWWPQVTTKKNTTKRQWYFFSWNKSETNIYHMGDMANVYSYQWFSLCSASHIQMGYLSINSVTWREMLGCQAKCLVCIQHWAIPWCPSWIYSKQSFCDERGTAMQLLIRRRLWWIINVLLAIQYDPKVVSVEGFSGHSDQHHSMAFAQSEPAVWAWMKVYYCCFEVHRVHTTSLKYEQIHSLLGFMVSLRLYGGLETKHLQQTIIFQIYA